MKQFLLFACLSVFSFGLSAQVFVDGDATGSGDGTSWADAYTNLNDAIIAADAGSELWIADGTYVTPDSIGFFIDKELSLIGGFNGTETDSGEADSDANVTILSGDVMGNDVEGVYDTMSRIDNQSVVIVSDTNEVQAFTVTIAGLTIANGNAEGWVEGEPLTNFSGGGIRAFGRVFVSDVDFRANHADFGSAVATVGASADGSVFDNTDFSDNYTGDRWVFYNRLTDNVQIRKSNFSGANEGTVAQGMVFALDCLTFTVEDTDFSDISTVGRGGAISTQDCAIVEITGCDVTNSEADLGGAFYLRNFTGFGEDADIPGETLVENCTFETIGSSRWGGVIFVSQVNTTMRGLTISDVEALTGGGLGGALYLQSNADPGVLPLVLDWSDIDISDVEAGSTGGGIFVFSDPDYEISLSDVSLDNVSAVGSGGGLYINGGGPALGDDNVAQLDNITINNAVANARPDGSGGFGGGSIFFAQDVNITNSIFSRNESALDGGNGAGVYGQGDGFTITIDSSEFSRNRALSGSGLAVFGRPISVTVTNSNFEENGRATVAGNAYRGGGMAFFHGAGSEISIDNSTMTGNAVTQQTGIVSGGGALYLGGLDDVGGTLSVTNTQMNENSAQDVSNGGAVYFVDGVTATFDNADMAFNTAGDGGAMYSFLFEIPDTIDGVPSPTLPDFDVEVRNSIIRDNTGAAQGGAVTTQRSLMSFYNTVFARNAVGSEGSGGGAIIFNGASPNVNENGDFESASPAELEAEIVHCTFFENLNNQDAEGAAGNAIALFQPQNPFNDVVQSMTITLQNNVFFQGGEDQTPIEFEPATEDPTTAFGDINIVSLGGNFFNVENGPNVTLGADDTVDETAFDAEELFVDPFEEDNDFPLLVPNPETENNPLIDSGTTGALVPETGLDGNPRGETPDLGAYELPWDVTNVETVAESGLDVDIFPNPTADLLNIRSNDVTLQRYRALLTDANGRLLRNLSANGPVNTLNLTDLPVGVYTLQLIVDGNVYSQQVVKQ